MSMLRAHAQILDEDEAEDSGDQREGQGHSVTWRRRAISLCDVTWEPICILKFLSQVGPISFRLHAVFAEKNDAPSHPALELALPVWEILDPPLQ